MSGDMPEGVFPRLNASLLRQGSYTDCLASFVGKLESPDTFRCCDGGTIALTEVMFDMEGMDKEMVYEIMGQATDQNTFQVSWFGMDLCEAPPQQSFSFDMVFFMPVIALLCYAALHRPRIIQGHGSCLVQ